MNQCFYKKLIQNKPKRANKFPQRVEPNRPTIELRNNQLAWLNRAKLSRHCRSQKSGRGLGLLRCAGSGCPRVCVVGRVLHRQLVCWAKWFRQRSTGEMSARCLVSAGKSTAVSWISVTTFGAGLMFATLAKSACTSKSPGPRSCM